MRRARVAFVTAAVLAVGVAGCSSGDSGSSDNGSGGLSGSITVLAAASLTNVFNTLGRQFEAAHPGTKVTFSYGASSALAEQITSGSPADVFASASATNMDLVVQAGHAGDPTTFASNSMEIATPPGNPAKVTGVDSLTDPKVTVALCQAEAPCGVTAQKVFGNAAVTVTPKTYEPDVRSVLAKVTNKEVDAGVVYVTDVRAAGSAVEGVEIPAGINATTSYPIVVLKDAPNNALAAAFVAYVLSPDGLGVLGAAGFAAP